MTRSKIFLSQAVLDRLARGKEVSEGRALELETSLRQQERLVASLRAGQEGGGVVRAGLEERMRGLEGALEGREEAVRALREAAAGAEREYAQVGWGRGRGLRVEGCCCGGAGGGSRQGRKMMYTQVRWGSGCVTRKQGNRLSLCLRDRLVRQLGFGVGREAGQGVHSVNFTQSKLVGCRIPVAANCT